MRLLGQKLNTYVIFLDIARFSSTEVIVFCILSSNDLDGSFPMASPTKGILLDLEIIFSWVGENGILVQFYFES